MRRGSELQSDSSTVEQPCLPQHHRSVKRGKQWTAQHHASDRQGACTDEQRSQGGSPSVMLCWTRRGSCEVPWFGPGPPGVLQLPAGNSYGGSLSKKCPVSSDDSRHDSLHISTSNTFHSHVVRLLRTCSMQTPELAAAGDHQHPDRLHHPSPRAGTVVQTIQADVGSCQCPSSAARASHYITNTPGSSFHYLHRSHVLQLLLGGAQGCASHVLCQVLQWPCLHALSRTGTGPPAGYKAAHCAGRTSMSALPT